MNGLILIWLTIVVVIPLHFLLAKWCGDKKPELKLLIWLYAFLGIYVSVFLIDEIYFKLGEVVLVTVPILCFFGIVVINDKMWGFG